MRPSNLLSLLTAASLVAAVGCGKKDNKDTGDTSGGGGSSGGGGGSGGGSPTLTVSGTINLGAALTGDAPDTVIAVPLRDGAAKPEALGSLQTSTLDANGEFELPLSDQDGNVSDYVLVVLDSKKAEDDQFVNFVGLPASDDANLLNLPMQDAAGTLDTGEVKPDATSPDAKAQTTAAEGAPTLGISTETAEQFADTGAVVRVIKNQLNNCERSSTGRCIDAQTTFTWDATAATMVDAWSDPTVWSYYGYSFILGFHGTSYRFADVCKAGNPITLTFLPPEDIKGSTFGSEDEFTVTAAAGVSNAGLTKISANSWGNQCGPETEDAHSIAYIGDNGDSFNFIPFSGASFTAAIPKGDWRLTVAGPNGLAEAYAFDLAAASPLDKAGVARVWVPAIRLTTEAGTDLVKKVEVKFYTYNAAKGWVETTDTAALLAAVGGAGEDGNTSSGGIWFLFDDSGQSPRLSESVRLTLEPGTNVFSAESFKNVWHLPLAGETTRPATGNYPGLRLDYLLRGTQINFSVTAR